MLVADEFTWGGTLLDYSEGGAQISATLQMGVGSTVIFRFQRPDDAALVEIQGLVRRTAIRGTINSDQVSIGVQSNSLLSSVPPLK